MPIVWWNDFKVGFGLWNSIPFTIIIEGAIFIFGAYLYIKSTRSEKRLGNISLYSLLIFLVLVYIMNMIGPLPTETEPIAYVGLSQWLIVWWGYWIDRKRKIIN